ncbi:60S acidic ribosomal protein P0 [Sarcoptes scabiei]|nr:60S acidic ribosomal protein P0 [Sarcoptes scabiei]
MDNCILISVIICMRNSQNYLIECLESIRRQTYTGPIELSVFDDGSSDESIKILSDWYESIAKTKDRHRFELKLSSNFDQDKPLGVGGAKNRAIHQSSGKFLCFQDSDDIMNEERILKQLELAQEYPNSLIGSMVERIPSNSTPRYVQWANNLRQDQLKKQIYTCFGPTILMPTWFCSRECFDRVGRFDESSSTGVPEDLIFFYRHLELGGDVRRVEEKLLIYRYHLNATTFSIKDETIWRLRLKHLEKNFLRKWEKFSIWNAGKEGRRLYRSLPEDLRAKVFQFGDVDCKKIAKRFYTFEAGVKGVKTKPKIPIVDYRKLQPPIVICVKLGLTRGEFEKNLSEMNLIESIDYVHFG